MYISILQENRSYTDESGKKNHFGIDLINQTLKKKLFMMLIKNGKADFIQQDCQDRYRDYCSGGERLDSALNTAWVNGTLQPRIRVGGSQLLKAGQGDLTSLGDDRGWGIWLNRFSRILINIGQCRDKQQSKCWDFFFFFWNCTKSIN